MGLHQVWFEPWTPEEGPGSDAALDDLRLWIRVGAASSLPSLPMPLSDYVQAAALAAGVDASVVRGPTRRKRVSHFRQAAMTLARERGVWSFAQIGRAFGGRHHRTVMSACDVDWSLPERSHARLRVEAALNRLDAR